MSALADEQIDLQAEEQSGHEDQEEEQAPHTTLLKCVLIKNANHDELASHWVELYMASPEHALLIIMEFVVEASGSNYKIPKDAAMPFSYGDILLQSSLQYRSVSMYYPLITKTAEVFARRVVSFLEALLKAVYDIPVPMYNMFLQEVTGFLMACSESSVRPFRHTSTMLGLKMMTILCDLTSVDNELLKTLWIQMFNWLFVNRYQDVVDDIRFLCISELGLWFSKYPECHLEPHHLRYFFEALSDSSTMVRQCILANLSRLCRHEDLRTMCLELGCEFRQLFMNLSVDRENEIAEESLRVLTEFYRYSSEILSEDDCKVIEEFVFFANRGVAQAAAEFFVLRRKETEEAPFSQKIRHLLQFYVDRCEHEHAGYLVDSFWDNCEMVLDWEPMIKMLMEEQYPNLTEAESSALIEILTKGVIQAITGEIPQGRYTKDLKRQPKAGAQVKATELLAPVLPQLLRKYVDRPDDVINLLELPQYFCSKYYREINNQGQLEKLLDEMDILMFHQTSNRVLRRGAHTLSFLFKMERTHLHILQMLNSAVTNYKIALRTWQERYGLASSSSSTSSSDSSKTPKSRSRRLLNTLRLLCALYAHFNLSFGGLTESVLSSLKRVVRVRDMGKDGLPAEAVSLYLAAGYFSLFWDLYTFRKEAASNSNMDDSCAALKKHFEDYLFVTFEQIVSANNMSQAYSCLSFICDLFVLYGYQLLDSHHELVRSLAYAPTINEVEILDNFVLRHLFRTSPADLMKESNFLQLQVLRRSLASYCKLVAFNVIPPMRAARIYQYYEKYYAPFGDVLRCSMELTIKVNSIHYGMALFHTGMLLYQKIMDDNGGDSVRAAGSPEFLELISLATRLAETLSCNTSRNRNAMITLHKAGIMYVKESVPDRPTAAPKNLLFLRVMQMFVPQLLRQDKVKILELLQTIEQPALPSCNREEWEPLEAYRSALGAYLRRGRSDVWVAT
ncbi:cohesin subunit SA-2 [Drosophila subpulchrella]|uniref:cohesin subunit SA-2 n=1 Tax=Drosophila subpulchrella TaxID=1486046 RepID=UPI0018A165BC|nr:cohesin subunit SA-2 [Drosophila subpulchrella]